MASALPASAVVPGVLAASCARIPGSGSTGSHLVAQGQHGAGQDAGAGSEVDHPGLAQPVECPTDRSLGITWPKPVVITRGGTERQGMSVIDHDGQVIP